MTGEICPVPACGAPRKRRQAMCRSCWGAVPPAEQRAVYRAWRDYLDQATAVLGVADAKLRLKALSAYRAALDAAIAAVVARR